MTKRRLPKPWGSRAARSTAGSRSTGSFNIGGPEMAPNPPIARRAPAKPWRASIVVTGDGAPKWPSTLIRSERPSGSWGALLDIRDAPLARPWVLLDLAVLVVPKRVTACVPPGHVQGFN